MKYEILAMMPLQPIIVRYKEDENEREDLFYLTPDNGNLIPAFGPGEGPKEVKDFLVAFQTAFKKMVESQRSRIVRASPIPPGVSPGGPMPPPGKPGGLIIPG